MLFTNVLEANSVDDLSRTYVGTTEYSFDLQKTVNWHQ